MARPAASRDPAVVAGLVALGAAVVLTLFAPPTLLAVVLGAVAVVGLGRHPRLGVLPAALLVVIAVPFGRAADSGLPVVAGIPLRFQDGALAAAVLLAVPRVRHVALRPAVVRIALLWLAVGLLALVVGVAEGQAIRDIFRDVRWWVLYGVVPLAAWVWVSRAAVLRAVLAGITIYALVVIAAAVLPAFEGALKDRAIDYDHGLLRLQFTNGVFLIVAVAWVVTRLLRRPSPGRAAWLIVLAAAVVLSLTRISILALVGVIVLALVVAGWREARARRTGAIVGRTAIVALLVAVPIALGVGLQTIGGAEGWAAESRNAVARIFFQGPDSGVDAIARGRGATYRAALDLIAARPVLGNGLGTLVEYPNNPGGSRPATPGFQPGVDNAYLTVAMKAGVVGLAAFVPLIAWPLVAIIRARRVRSRGWFVIAWLAVLGMTMTQSFATAGYAPFGVALLIVFAAVPRWGRSPKGALRPTG